MKTQYATMIEPYQTSTAVEGSRHDFAVFRESVPAFTEDLPHERGMAPDERLQRSLECPGDSAHTGMEKTVSQQISHVSRKRKPGKNLTAAEKYNKAPAKVRILVERAMRRAKVFGVMGDRRRNPRKKYAGINDMVCGLASMMRLWERRDLAVGQGPDSARRVSLFSNCRSSLLQAFRLPYAAVGQSQICFQVKSDLKPEPA